MSTTKDNQAQRWGKLEDSYDKSDPIEGAHPQQTLHLMNEDTKITGQKVTIYAGLQFDVQEKTLAEKAKEFIVDKAPKVQESITTATRLGLSGLVGFAKYAGGFVYGKVSDLVSYIEKEQQERKTKEKEKLEEEQKNQEQIHDNWEFIVKGTTPAEILQQLEQSESDGSIKITRINDAQSLQNMAEQQDGRIIQLENSNTSFCQFMNGPNINKAQKKEFDMVDSSVFEMRGALQTSMDPQQFEEMRLRQLEIACNQQLNWEMIFNLSGPMGNDLTQNEQQYNSNLIAQQQQEQLQQQQQQNQQQPQQIYPSVYRVDNFAPAPENTNQLGDMSQYSNLIKINLPSFNILTQSKYQQQQAEKQQQQQMQEMQLIQNAQQINSQQQTFPQIINSNYPPINANNYRYPPVQQQQQYYEEQEQEQEAMLN